VSADGNPETERYNVANAFLRVGFDIVADQLISNTHSRDWVKEQYHKRESENSQARTNQTLREGTRLLEDYPRDNFPPGFQMSN
jgi:hypothetical protein